MLHEIGHFLLVLAFGFPDLGFHYSGVSMAPRATGVPQWRQGLVAILGPLVTLAIVLASSFAALLLGVRPWLVAPAFATGWRTAGMVLGYSLTRLLNLSALAGREVDELLAARGLGVPAELIYGVELVLITAPG